MADPKLEAIKQQVCREFGVPLDYLEQVLELEEEKAHYTRRHGLLEDLRKLTAQTAQRSLPEVEA